MIVQGNKPKTEKPNPQDIQKQTLLAEFMEMDYSLILMAFVYARGYVMSGEDITKPLGTALQNNQFIEQIYRRGYEDCEKDYAQKKRKDFYHKALVDLKED